MKTRQLNIDSKKKIVEHLMKRAFGEEEKELKSNQQALGDRVYADVYPVGVSKRMQSLPEGFLPEGTVLMASFGGQVAQVCFSEPRRLSNEHMRNYRPMIIYPTDHDFSDAYRGLEARAGDLRRRRDLALKTASAVIASFKTVKKLIEAWPEIEVVLREVGELSTDDPVTALTVPVAELNRQFALGGRNGGKS